MSGVLSTAIAAVLLLIPWIPGFLAAASTWRDGLYYSAGWAAPWMAFALLWKRLSGLQFGRGQHFQIRRPPRNHGQPPVVFWTLTVLLAGIAAAWLRLIETADPFWRLGLVLQWLWSAGVSSLLAGLLIGPAGARSLAGCQLFLAAAMPWPLILERAFVEPLNAFVGRASTQILEFAGQPTRILEDQLLLPGGAWSLNEVCGGVHSFPAAVLLALGFGEWFRLTPLRRLLLIAASLLLAAAGNLARMLWLAPDGAIGSAAIIGGSLLLLLVIAGNLQRRERDSHLPLPILRWHPAIFFLLLAWPAAEAAHWLGGKALLPHLRSILPGEPAEPAEK